jgi:hypothetical protein
MAASLVFAKQMPVGRTSLFLNRRGWVRPSHAPDATGVFVAFTPL